eukprot:119831-Prorocentrum_minimum.AAC.2
MTWRPRDAPPTSDQMCNRTRAGGSSRYWSGWGGVGDTAQHLLQSSGPEVLRQPRVKEPCDGGQEGVRRGSGGAIRAARSAEVQGIRRGSEAR